MPTVRETDPTTNAITDESPAGEVGDIDLAVVTGTLSSDPTVLELASGSLLHRYEVTSRHVHGTDTVPVVWFDPGRVPALAAGDRVVVVGRVRRRFYRAGGATRSATEVVATSVARARATSRARRALAAALDELA